MSNGFLRVFSIFFRSRQKSRFFYKSFRKATRCINLVSKALIGKIHRLDKEKSMRIDKFLKVSRILKRRTVAGDACKAGKVSVNGKDVKPAYNLKIGDEVELKFAAGSLKFRVLALKETVKKEEAATLYEIISDGEQA